MRVSIFREYACTELPFESGKRTVGWLMGAVWPIFGCFIAARSVAMRPVTSSSDRPFYTLLATDVNCDELL